MVEAAWRLTVCFRPPLGLGRSVWRSAFSITSSNKKRSFPVRKKTTQVMSSDHEVSVHDCLLPSSGLRARLFYPCIWDPATPRAPWFPPSATLIPNENALGLAEYLQLPLPNLSWPAIASVIRSSLPHRLDAEVLVDGKFPLALFSHGLGGSLAGYPSFCAAIAARGYVVVAVEHADGSAFGAYTGADRKRIPYARLPAGVDEFPFRNRQLGQRVRELDAVLADMRAIGQGAAVPVPLEGFRSPGTTVDFVDKIDVDAPIIVAGHSFGAGTTLAFCDAAARGDVSARVSYALCLDPWIYPLGQEKVTALDIGDAKVLFVDQERSQMTSSLALRRMLPGKNYWAVKVEDGGHNNASDFALRLPYAVATRSGLTPQGSDPQELMHCQNDAAVAFIDEERWHLFELDVERGAWQGLVFSHLPDSVRERAPGIKRT